MPRERSEDRVRGRGRGGGRGKGRGDGRERFRGDDEGKGKKKKGASIKSNIRGIERLLSVKGGSLPESVKRDKEEQLEVLKRMHDERNRRVKTRKIKLRYRRIKFFEKKKLIVERKRIEAAVKSGETKEEDAMDKKEQIYKDLLYIKYFPEDKPYVALFPKTEHSEHAKEEIRKMRAEVERKLEAGDNAEISEIDEEIVTDGEIGAENDNNEEEEDDFFEEEDKVEEEVVAVEERKEVAVEEKKEAVGKKKKVKRGVRGKRKRKLDEERAD